jgi:hypothetical protein
VLGAVAAVLGADGLFETGKRIADTGCNGHEVTARLSKIVGSASHTVRVWLSVIKRIKETPQVTRTRSRDDRRLANACLGVRKPLGATSAAAGGEQRSCSWGCDDHGHPRESWHAQIVFVAASLPARTSLERIRLALPTRL